MKKRFMSLLLVLVMVFSLLPISAMAQVYPVGEQSTAVEIRFYKGDKLISTQRVNNIGTQDGKVPAGAIYDPGCPLDEQETFVKWTWNDGSGSVQDLLTYVNANYSKLQGKTLVVTAETSHVFYLVYRDEDNRVLKTQAVPSTDATATVQQGYVPNNPKQQLAGWSETKGATEVQYANGASITLTKNTDLYPVCESGFWLLFDSYIEQDPDTTTSTFTAPVFYQGTEDTVKPSNPTRSGYTFEGWFTDKDFTSAFTFGGKLTEDTTLYAKWEPAEAQYTIVFWRQDPTDSVDMSDNEKHYSFDSAVVKTATTGETVNLDNSGVALNPGTGFSVNDNKTQRGNVTVKADGSTTINVYYDRNAYTLTFQVNKGNYYYADWKTVKTVTELYGHSIKDYFPINGTDGQNYNGYLWEDTDSSTFQYYLATLDTMPAADETFHGGYMGTEKTIYYYKEVIPGVTPTGQTRVFNQKTYELYKTVNHGFNYLTYDEEYHSVEGFSRDRSHAEPYFGQTYYYGTSYNNTDETYYDSHVKWRSYGSDRDDNIAPIKYDGLCNYLYYDRNEWKLEFFDGFDKKAIGGENQVAPVLRYEEPLENYGNLFTVSNGGQTITYNGVSLTHKGYLFAGWYADQACTTPFDFTNAMPNHDVPVYAKWTLMRFRVVVDPRGGDASIPTSDIRFDAATQSTTFRVDYGEQVEKGGLDSAVRTDPNHPNTTYQLVGWYYVDKDGKEHDFNFAYAEWDEIADMSYKDASDEARRGTDPWSKTTYDDADGKHNDVVGKVTIYARWRQRLQSNESLRVLYDAANGKIGDEQTYLDPMFYADHAQAIAQPASVSNVPGEQFSVWEVLNQSGEPTGAEVRPGDTFNVLLANAVESTDAQGGKVYTVTLRAKYVSNPTTHITWVANDGDATKFVNSPDANLNAEISIMPADTFTRDGYEFLGWARLNENEMKNDDGTWKPYTGNELWLKWDAEHSKWLLQDNTEARAISADNQTPHHVLYAVWDKIDNHNYVIDFNGKMTIATSATAKKDDSHNNGAFEVADGNATYQLDYQLSNTEAESSTYRANLAFSGIDTALINGVPVGSAEGTTASWEKYTVIPANNVYFDDSLVGKSMTAGDGSGYNAEVSKYNTALAGQSNTKIEITFTGTGIDVYCTTPDANGWIQATVDGTNKQPYTNTKYQGENAPLYNIPVVSFRDLGAGSHTLVITTLTNANFQLDGIRVYNGMQDATGDDATTVNNAYAAANEQNAVFMQVRQYLLSKAQFESVSETGVDTGETAVAGAVFIDTNEATTSVADYKAAGPKNEVYLASGQGVAFQIKDWASFKDTNKVMVGLSVPAGETATVAASGRTNNNKIQLNAETHMFYEIKPDNDGNVYIYNTGNAMVSVTDLKITGTQQYAAPATFTLGAPITPESEGGALTVSPKLLMRYVQDFDPEAVIEDPQVIDEPQTPENPDDGDKPGWNDNSYNPMTILKNLFQNLLNSLSGLFGGLGNW